MPAVYNKIASLEFKQRIERMKQRMEMELIKAALENEKRDRAAERKEVEQRMELIKMQAALENEKRPVWRAPTTSLVAH
jgi:hypothetical protein